MIGIGEPAPWFLAAKDAGQVVQFDELGGRHLVLLFFGHATSPVVEAFAEIERCPLFDGDHALCVSVSSRREYFSEGTVPRSRAGHLHLLDERAQSAQRYGLTPLARPVAFILSPALQVFDRPFCESLTNLYDEAGGREIGVIEREGEVLKHFNPEFRKRLDHYITDAPTIIRC